MKEKISISLSKEILDEIDNLIDDQASRSRIIENLLRNAIKNQKISQAFILAGGVGTRLRPFTYEMPKSLIPVNGKPIAEHIINRLKIFGIRNIIFSVGYKAERIMSHFGNGSKFGVNIDYSFESKPLGTAGPLKLAENMLDKKFLMLNGDNLSNLNFQSFINQYVRSKKKASIVLVEVSDPSRYGVAKVEGDKIIDFLEKPTKSDAPTSLINAGIYALDKSIINHVKPNKKQSIETDVFPKLAKNGELGFYIHSGTWYPVGTQKEFEKVQLNKENLKWLG